jgi:choline dehydrogenase-like flavoprotein
VVANRLTENRNWNVLLIEAGNVETIMQNIPLFAAVNQKTSYDWAFLTEPQTNACRASYNSRCTFPRGKGVGGSSIINYMIHNRGHHNDQDRWEKVYGNEGWAYEKVEKYFSRAEGKTLGDLKNSLKIINIAVNPYKTKLAHAFVDAHKSLGFDEIQYNKNARPGVSYLQANTEKGLRQTAFRAFITEILDRANFHLLVGSHVTKILIDERTKTAYGVEFNRYENFL